MVATTTPSRDVVYSIGVRVCQKFPGWHSWWVSWLAYCICRHRTSVHISSDDGAASVTQAAAVHVVPIYDLGTAFSFPFKSHMVIGASSSSVGRVYCNYTE
jgi:hypothetical protein